MIRRVATVRQVSAIRQVSATIRRTDQIDVMVISVLERRSEVGLRRALGATRGHIGLQFLTTGLDPTRALRAA